MPIADSIIWSGRAQRSVEHLGHARGDLLHRGRSATGDVVPRSVKQVGHPRVKPTQYRVQLVSDEEPFGLPRCKNLLRDFIARPVIQLFIYVGGQHISPEKTKRAMPGER